MLQWACAHLGAILVTVNPAYRTQELVSFTSNTDDVTNSTNKINTIKLAGIKHLFVVPQIRTSQYVQMLTEALPEMRNSTPGNIQDPNVPELRNFIVMDNQGAFWDQRHKLDVKSATDWREILMWGEGWKEQKLLRETSASLDKDDIINLQFTRWDYLGHLICVF